MIDKKKVIKYSLYSALAITLSYSVITTAKTYTEYKSKTHHIFKEKNLIISEKDFTDFKAFLKANPDMKSISDVNDIFTKNISQKESTKETLKEIANKAAIKNALTNISDNQKIKEVNTQNDTQIINLSNELFKNLYRDNSISTTYYQTISVILKDYFKGKEFADSPAIITLSNNVSILSSVLTAYSNAKSLNSKNVSAPISASFDSPNASFNKTFNGKITEYNQKSQKVIDSKTIIENVKTIKSLNNKYQIVDTGNDVASLSQKGIKKGDTISDVFKITDIQVFFLSNDLQTYSKTPATLNNDEVKLAMTLTKGLDRERSGLYTQEGSKFTDGVYLIPTGTTINLTYRYYFGYNLRGFYKVEYADEYNKMQASQAIEQSKKASSASSLSESISKSIEQTSKESSNYSESTTDTSNNVSNDNSDSTYGARDTTTSQDNVGE
ncbi:hypothetical protein [Pseudolactococcus insecticola]|uniref:Uncharacterized protein n=1 Tax=Pseudolactococcus insecticola TaxID=2709158 RepID=A0A6A0B9J7_9LACT|nr:hypothetical protein [Lactococcus insecticola]GFH41395.1 hypothetical protein Hs20B_17930 [Lactococcus insecticola]